MADQLEGKWVVPNPQVPRTFGILNIIFGILLLLVGIYTIVMTAFGPKFQNAMITQMKEQQAEKKAVRDARIAELKKKEEAAKTKEDKESITEQREAMERSAEPDFSVVMGNAVSVGSDRRIVISTYVESTAGILLNGLMIASGVGLLWMAEWGRRLALGVAWLKILRWVAIVSFTLVVVVPMTTEMTQKVLGEVEKQTRKSGGAAPIPMATLAQFAAIAAAVSSVVSGVFASIYPALSLWFLTRPATRAAILVHAKPAAPPPEFEPGEPS